MFIFLKYFGIFFYYLTLFFRRIWLKVSIIMSGPRTNHFGCRTQAKPTSNEKCSKLQLPNEKVQLSDEMVQLPDEKSAAMR
jgi:hypothetical protein